MPIANASAIIPKETSSAYAFDWTETLDAKCMNGESLELQLREDQQFMLDSAIDVRGTGLYAAMNEMSAWMQVLPDAPKLKDLFDSLQEGVNLVTSVADQVELVGNQIEAKIARVESICNQMDSALGILSKPVNMRLLDALHSTWEAAVKLHKDILQTGASPLKYTTGAAMTIAQVAQAMYGDTARAMDIMKMNAIEDPFRIPRGTMLLGPGLSRTA